MRRVGAVAVPLRTRRWDARSENGCGETRCTEAERSGTAYATVKGKLVTAEKRGGGGQYRMRVQGVERGGGGGGGACRKLEF
jgi:hypothetical protein